MGGQSCYLAFELVVGLALSQAARVEKESGKLVQRMVPRMALHLEEEWGLFGCGWVPSMVSASTVEVKLAVEVVWV